MNAERGELIIVDDAAALARALAERIVAAGRRALSRHAHFDLTLAGGSTPKAAYELLAAPPFWGDLDWSSVRFFFGDERCVPPDDDESNYKMAADALRGLIAERGATVLRMHGEDDPRDAARAYADVLRRTLGPAPVFDLILLGLGPDGHTASLFPGSDPFADDALLVRAPFVPKFEAYRLTLTPSVLNGAREIVVAVSGESKADAFHAVLDGPRDPTRYPATLLAPRAGTLTWLVDRAAAAKLDD